MAYGLLQQGSNVKQQAMGGMRQAAQLEQNRNQQNTAIKMQDKQAKTANATAGATTGAMIGAGMASTVAANTAAGIASTGATAAIGGMGALGAGLATGGIGLVAGLLLSELF